jgi:hypothetical protein
MQLKKLAVNEEQKMNKRYFLEEAADYLHMTSLSNVFTLLQNRETPDIHPGGTGPFYRKALDMGDRLIRNINHSKYFWE